MSKTTRAFKSGNSIAVRLPAAFGVKAGTELRVREERGRYVLEPIVGVPKKIDLTGIFGSIPGIQRQPFEHKGREPRDDRS